MFILLQTKKSKQESEWQQVFLLIVVLIVSFDVDDVLW